MAEGSGMTGAQWAQLAATIGGTAASAYLAKRGQDKADENEEKRNQMTEEQHLRQTALAESLADPFRHQVDQTRALTSLDMLQQFGQGGRHITPPANVARFSGNVRPGYTPSQTMRDHAAALYSNVAGGNTAPTMTDPANYGRTGAVNLTAGQSAGGPVATPDEAIDPTSYLAGMQRRNEGAGGVWNGVKKGTGVGLTAAKFVGPYAPLAIAGGAVIGGIAGAFTKNAKTAKDDLSLDQAREAIRQVYQREGGREPAPEEVESIIAGQGYKPGDWGVGEGGMLAVIRNLQANFANERRGRAA